MWMTLQGCLLERSPAGDDVAGQDEDSESGASSSSGGDGDEGSGDGDNGSGDGDNSTGGVPATGGANDTAGMMGTGDQGSGGDTGDTGGGGTMTATQGDCPPGWLCKPVPFVIGNNFNACTAPDSDSPPPCNAAGNCTGVIDNAVCMFNVCAINCTP